MQKGVELGQSLLRRYIYADLNNPTFTLSSGQIGVQLMLFHSETRQCS